MRSLLYILSLLMLVLSLKPCSDTTVAEAVEGGIVVELMDFQSGHQDSSAADQCTPFCACHCCHTHYQSKAVEMFSNLCLPEAERLLAVYKGAFISFLSYSIWQPPKVA